MACPGLLPIQNCHSERTYATGYWLSYWMSNFSDLPSHEMHSKPDTSQLGDLVYWLRSGVPHRSTQIDSTDNLFNPDKSGSKFRQGSLGHCVIHKFKSRNTAVRGNFYVLITSTASSLKKCTAKLNDHGYNQHCFSTPGFSLHSRDSLQ